MCGSNFTLFLSRFMRGTLKIIFVKFAMTDAVPKSAPFIHLLLYFIRTIMLGGPSVKALASGI